MLQDGTLSRGLGCVISAVRRAQDTEHEYLPRRYREREHSPKRGLPTSSCEHWVLLGKVARNCCPLICVGVGATLSPACEKIVTPCPTPAIYCNRFSSICDRTLQPSLRQDRPAFSIVTWTLDLLNMLPIPARDNIRTLTWLHQHARSKAAPQLHIAAKHDRHPSSSIS